MTSSGGPLRPGESASSSGGESSTLSAWPWSPGLAPATREATSTYVGELERVARDTPGAFSGVSGGRSAVAELLLETVGSGKDQVRSEAVRDILGGDVSAKSERPAQGVLPFVCDRLSVPGLGADFPLLAWVPETWRRALEQPDSHLKDPNPVGPFPRMYLRVSREE